MSENILIHVYTGDRVNAGTNANVQISLYDENKSASSPILLDNFLSNNFERGNLDSFTVPVNMISSLKPPVRISRIELWKNSTGLASDWFVDKIEVENLATNERFVFPIFRWIKPNIHYQIKLLDTSLPQFDEFPDQRRKGLEEKRASYQLAQKRPNGPVQAKSLPSDEAFSFAYKWDIEKMSVFYELRKTFLTAVGSENFSSIEEISTIYDGDHFKPPEGIDHWDDDLRFGMQRVASLNHSVISLVTEIPDKFPVTDALLKPFLEGSTIQESIKKKRLFICDLDLLEGVQCKYGFTLCAPIGLFYLDSEAIQLQQVPTPDNPIFTPRCHRLTWALVKLWYNNADAAYHQSLTHLGYTHMLMEGIALTSHRHLSVSHPIFKILAPHFLYLIAINYVGIATLLNPGGWVDQVLNSGSDGMNEIIKRGFQNWRMDVEGTLTEDMKKRGFDSDSVLPCYYYREDALLVYNAIHKYVTSYVDLYYTSPEMLKGDNEIQSWIQECVKERDDSKGGLGIQTAETTKEEILKCLPSREDILKIMDVAKILSTKGTKSLGDFEVQYVFDPEAIKLVDIFRQDLADISQKIKERNNHRDSYEYLDPKFIPNSISI